jgi:hypothetical protein
MRKTIAPSDQNEQIGVIIRSYKVIMGKGVQSSETKIPFDKGAFRQTINHIRQISVNAQTKC